MNTNDVSLGLTGNFLTALILRSKCVEGFEGIDPCMDATEYTPAGYTASINNITIFCAVDAR